MGILEKLNLKKKDLLEELSLVNLAIERLETSPEIASMMDLMKEIEERVFK